MQDSYSKLKANPTILAILASVPFVMAGILMILPTFDDWNTLSSPNYDKEFMKFMLPYGTTWRPGDALFGYINALDYRIFPSLNHILIFLAHVASTLLVYVMANRVGLSKTARNIATIFFYLSPCVCGTIYSCDALNQTYSHLWGMAAVYTYLIYRDNNRRKIACWVLFVWLSALSKDNGITWAIVPPMVAYAFGRETKRDMAKDIGLGFGIVCVYMAVRLSLPHTILHNGSHLEQMASLQSKLKGLATWVGYTWVAADYIYLMHAPSRNLPLFAVTAALSMPFVLACFLRMPHKLMSRPVLAMTMAILTTASANLLISMSVMNAYCSLGMAALLLACLIDFNADNKNLITTLFTIYTATAIAVDCHHWYKSWQTSLPAKSIAMDIIRKTGKPVEKVFNISIHNERDKFSSFCVPKDEAIGWGGAMLHYNAYKWPKEIKDTTINSDDATRQTIKNIADSALNCGYECVWIVGENETTVLRRQR